ncbi:lactate utilization protein C [Ornithinibacillus sp. L9]|uniref:Lactate utilization protein C n=1 Tax=Ornithinibacillus caprae TaxID=2678566 RepID=A0A6N8FHN4_9BACI|nr:lactate utilization protein C [Ornithinibacillus caprae]MUK87567.1 lactate utilization protein C [Ornithinibacillus caprae]
MGIQNRESFLNNVAENLGRERRTQDVKRPEWSVNPQWDVYRDFSQDELVDVLEKQCEVIHTDFKRTNKENLVNVLAETIEGFDGNSIVAANDERNVSYGLVGLFDKLHQDGKEVHIWDPNFGNKNREFAERADVGITFSDITLAESGTVTLFNNKNNGRSISLLPRTYIAIIPKRTIVPRMTQATKQIHEANQEGHNVSSCISFITGPSNSADIEMKLIVGVHGPVNVCYVVVE